jgi:hypothetical protein
VVDNGLKEELLMFVGEKNIVVEHDDCDVDNIVVEEELLVVDTVLAVIDYTMNGQDVVGEHNKEEQMN